MEIGKENSANDTAAMNIDGQKTIEPTQQQSKSHQPILPPPTITESGQDSVVTLALKHGPRLKHLKLAIHKMLQSTIKSTTHPDLIEQCFVGVKDCAGVCAVLKGELESIYDTIGNEVARLIESDALGDKLDEVDRYTKEHNNNNSPKIENIHANKLDNPQALIDAKLASTRAQQSLALRQELATLRAQNAALSTQLAAQVAAITTTLTHLNDSRMVCETSSSKLCSDGVGMKFEQLVDLMALQK